MSNKRSINHFILSLFTACNYIISLLYHCKTFLPIIKRYGQIFSEFYVNTYSKHNNFQPNCIGNIILVKNNGS